MNTHAELNALEAATVAKELYTEALVKSFKRIEIGGATSYREQLLERGYQTLPLRLQPS